MSRLDDAETQKLTQEEEQELALAESGQCHCESTAHDHPQQDQEEVGLTGITQLVGGSTWYELSEGGWVIGDYLDTTTN